MANAGKIFPSRRPPLRRPRTIPRRTMRFARNRWRLLSHILPNAPDSAKKGQKIFKTSLLAA
jgi:hypothetical protein